MPGFLDSRTGVSWGWADGENNWGGAMNKSLQDIAYIGTHPLVQRIGESTPPLNPMPGDMYVVGTSPTHTWSTFAENSLVVWGRDPTQSYLSFVWIFITPKEGFLVYNSADKKLYSYNGTAWVLITISSVTTDGTTALGIGTATDKIRVANPFTAAFQTKLEGIETGAQINVKPDWNADPATPAGIQNKPALAGVGLQTQLPYVRTSYVKAAGLFRDGLYGQASARAGNVNEDLWVDREAYFRRAVANPYIVIITDGVTAYTSSVPNMPSTNIAARRQFEGRFPLASSPPMVFMFNANSLAIGILLGRAYSFAGNALPITVRMGDKVGRAISLSIATAPTTTGSQITINGSTARMVVVTGLSLGIFTALNANFFFRVSSRTGFGIAARLASTEKLSAVNSSGNLVSIV